MSVPRSWLYVPGHRPDHVRKAPASGADAVVLDRIPVERGVDKDPKGQS